MGRTSGSVPQSVERRNPSRRGTGSAAGPSAAAVMEGIAAGEPLIGGSPLFEHVAAEELHKILQAARGRTVRRDEFCFLQGDPATTAYVLLSGVVKLIRSDADGHAVIVRLVNPLEPFGHAGILDGGVHRVSAQATRDSRVLAWGSLMMHRLMRDHPALEVNYLHFLAVCIEDEWERLHALATARMEQRIAGTLLTLAHRSADTLRRGRPVEVPLPHRDLAEFVGTNVYTVSRILSRWKRTGIVESRRGCVLIRSSSELKRIAEERARPAEALREEPGGGPARVGRGARFRGHSEIPPAPAHYVDGDATGVPCSWAPRDPAPASGAPRGALQR